MPDNCIPKRIAGPAAFHEGSSGKLLPEKLLPEAARRALAEAEVRRATEAAREPETAKEAERGGRGGLDPVRYDDWEIGGRAVDF